MGEVSKAVTIEEARDQALEGAPERLDVSGYEGFDSDCMLGKTKNRDKKLSLSDEFCIASFGRSQTIYYYDLNGILRKIELLSGLSFPSTGHVYAYPQGKLEAVRYYASREETMNFNADGSFHSRWKGDLQFDPSGQIIGQRTNLSEF